MASAASEGREYSSKTARPNETLVEPVGVAIFRHYLFVAEAQGNTIKVVTLDYHHTNTFKFVTMFTPTAGVQLTGSVAASPKGYVWYTYQDSWTDWELASYFLEEPLREGKKRELWKDFVLECVNEAQYHTMVRENSDNFTTHVDYICNLAFVNCRYPDEVDYIDPYSFNSSNLFDLDLLNSTIFGGRLTLCATGTVVSFAVEESEPEGPRLASPTSQGARGSLPPAGGAWWSLAACLLVGLRLSALTGADHRWR